MRGGDGKKTMPLWFDEPPDTLRLCPGVIADTGADVRGVSGRTDALLLLLGLVTSMLFTIERGRLSMLANEARLMETCA